MSERFASKKLSVSSEQFKRVGLTASPELILMELPELFDQSLLACFLNERVEKVDLEYFIEEWLANNNMRLRPYHHCPIAVLEQKQLIYAGRFEYITIGDTTHNGSGFNDNCNIIAPELLSPFAVVSPFMGVDDGNEEIIFDLDGSFEFQFDSPDLPLASN